MRNRKNKDEILRELFEKSGLVSSEEGLVSNSLSEILANQAQKIYIVVSTYKDINRLPGLSAIKKYTLSKSLRDKLNKDSAEMPNVKLSLYALLDTLMTILTGENEFGENIYAEEFEDDEEFHLYERMSPEVLKKLLKNGKITKDLYDDILDYRKIRSFEKSLAQAILEVYKDFISSILEPNNKSLIGFVGSKYIITDDIDTKEVFALLPKFTVKFNEVLNHILSRAYCKVYIQTKEALTESLLVPIEYFLDYVEEIVNVDNILFDVLFNIFYEKDNMNLEELGKILKFRAFVPVKKKSRLNLNELYSLLEGNYHES